MRRSLALCAALAATLCAGAATAQDGQAPDLIGEIVLPTGLMIAGVEFGGISGIDYDPARDLFYAISDDRSEKAPARFYTLKLAFRDDRLAGLDIAATHPLQGEDGKPFPTNGLDAEAIRLDLEGGRFFWASERDAARSPGLFEARLDGAFVRTLAFPPYYAPGENSGVQNNLAFESLALSADGTTLWAGTENGLAQDGGKSTPEAGSRARLLKLDVARGEPVAEYVYATDKVHARPEGEPAFGDAGLVELVVLDDTRLLAVERSFASGVGNEIKLYAVDVAGATDVLGNASIDALADVTPVAKEHLMTLSGGMTVRAGGGAERKLGVDNIEAATFGPEIGGRRTLVLASDNNFAPVQLTQFLVLSFP